ncbi:MAG: cytochrome c oxidase assembly factor Coa1 family protein [Defluviitaleaceae bacterium]|nr:cytochrome c oxidase assembly factor Coa1 family protein [Defluviitaleaceae bacterium]
MDFSYKTHPSLEIAPVWKRLVAFLIDHFIFSFVFVAPSVFYILLSARVLTGEMPVDVTRIVISSILITAVILLIYCLRDVIKGQSIGKRLLGIGVRDISDNSLVPSVPRLFLRQVLIFIWPIEFLSLVSSDENQKIGDKLANTGVYNLQKSPRTSEPHAEPHKPRKPKIAIIITGAFVAFVLFIVILVFSVGAMLKNHPSYQTATEYIRNSPEIAAIIGEVEGFGFMPSGGFNVSPGHGDANYSIVVKGTRGSVRVFVELQRRDGGDWEVVGFLQSNGNTAPKPTPTPPSHFSTQQTPTFPAFEWILEAEYDEQAMLSTGQAKLQLPEYPDVAFEWQYAWNHNGGGFNINNITAIYPSGEVRNIPMPSTDVFVADVNQDGSPDFAFTISWTSGVYSSGVVVYDLANDEFHFLDGYGTVNTLDIEDGWLVVTQSAWGGMEEPLWKGGLSLVNGELMVVGVDRIDDVPIPRASWYWSVSELS